jgi:transcription termination factor 2
MNTLVQSLLLRRTKTTKSAETGAEIVKLPPKEIKEHHISLSSEEKEVYDEVFSFSQVSLPSTVVILLLYTTQLFQQAMMTYMKKHQEKEDDKAYLAHMESGGRTSDYTFRPTEGNKLSGSRMAEESDGGGGDHFRPKLGPTGKDVKAHHLLVLLLRLRQICCHPGLIKSMIDTEARAAAGAIEDKELGADGVDDDLVSQLADMSLTSGASSKDQEIQSCLNLDNPVFKERRQSSKIAKVVEELTRIHERYEETGVMEKAVVVSQWTSMLEIIKSHVEKVGLRCTEINGKVPVKLRGDVVTAFNRKGAAPHVMLLSLAAGGVGLNLVGANHLFLLDMHWNPQLEQQACDRIYRVGQTREVTIHRFLCEDTVETRIQDLQRKKLDLAEGVLTGAKRTGANKLTMDDLKMLFNVQ